MIDFTIRQLQAQEGFAKNADRLGVNGDFIGKQFTARGTLWTVMGLNRRIRKNPVIAHDPNQKVREFPLDFVNQNLVQSS